VLIELIIVLVLIAIITGAVVPLYGASMGDVQRRSTRNHLVSVLLHIQERAVSETAEYRFYFQPELGTYWVERQADTAPDALERVFEPVNEVYGRPAQLPLNFVFSDVGRLGEDTERKALYIRCFPNGACDPVTFSIVDTRAKAKQFSVELTGALGQIRTETVK
jgi:type II secretory pathway pseudopilin PulG